MVQKRISDYVITNPLELYLSIREGLAEQRRAILELLLDFSAHPCFELGRIALQYNARIFELRRTGFKILSIKKADDKDKTWFILEKQGGNDRVG